MVYEYTKRVPETNADDALFSRNVPLAMAYVKDQSWETPMCAMDALNHGTAFKRLVKPFLGAEVCDEQ